MFFDIMNMIDSTNIKALLEQECNHRFSMNTPVMEKFLGLLTEIRLQKGEILTRCGQLDTNIYIIASGIIRLTYFDGLNERTFAFGRPGSLLMQMHCYYMRLPSFFQCNACTPCTMLKISKQEFDTLVDESAEFAKFVLDRALDQLCGLEMRLDWINGQSSDRFAAMMKIMPEVIECVSSRIIASYLGITPAYLSQLKKKIPYQNREEQNDVKSCFTSHSLKKK